ncbi:MAG: signal peptidase II [Planctomycetia bacterium]|nr:signal peptidase II [Planctomycetia bacterium]
MRAVPLNRYFIYGAIACAGCLTDLATKRWIFGKLGMPGGRTLWLWEGVFGLQTSLNQGALFGMGQGRVAVFAILSIAAMVGVLVWLFVAGAARDRLLTVALGCVTAGILGNLYDRLGLPGLNWTFANQFHALGEPVYAVRDWILVMIGPWRWPNFNIADPLLVLGAGLLAWHAFRTHKAEESAGNDPRPSTNEQGASGQTPG